MVIRVKLPNGQYGQFPDDTPHEQIESILQKQFPPTQQQSQIASTPFNAQQSTGQGAAEQDDEGIPIPELTGLSGVGSDLLSAALSAKDFAADVPNKLEKLGGNILEHPISGRLRPLGQLGAEGADIAKGVFNSAYNLNQYLARKHLLPQVLGKLGKILPHLPEDTGVENALGLKADPEKGDDLVRAIPDIAAALAGGGGLAKQGAKLFKGPNLKAALKETQAKVNQLDAELGKNFDTVEAEVEKRGIPPIEVSKETIKRATRFLDKSPETKALIEQASNGDYKALRQIQSDLRVIGEDALSNKLSTERNIGKEALSARNKMNSEIENHFAKTGHKDLAELLNQTKQGYKALKDTYFSNPALKQLFGENQKFPKNPLTLLTEDSTQMTRFFNAHPEMKELLSKALKHKRNKKYALIGLGMLGTGGTSGVVSHLLGK